MSDNPRPVRRRTVPPWPRAARGGERAPLLAVISPVGPATSRSIRGIEARSSASLSRRRTQKTSHIQLAVQSCKGATFEQKLPSSGARAMRLSRSRLKRYTQHSQQAALSCADIQASRYRTTARTLSSRPRTVRRKSITLCDPADATRGRLWPTAAGKLRTFAPITAHFRPYNGTSLRRHS